MRDSRFMIILYASMVGVPVLLYLRMIATLTGMYLAGTILLALSAIGLIAFGVVGFVEVFAHKGHERGQISRIPGENAVSTARSRGGDRDASIINIRVARFMAGPKAMEESIYRIEADKNTTVLGALIGIKENQDPTLSVRYSCRMGICGSCGVVINGKPSLACETNALNCMVDGEITVEPMYGHPLLKDLVTDFDDFFERHISVNPGIRRSNVKEKYAAKEPYKQSGDDIDRFLPYSYCIMCGLCMDACPVVNSNPEFIGPQALSQVHRYRSDSRDQEGIKRLQEVDTLNGVWGCEFAGACSKVCPKGVDPAGAIQLLKGDLMKNIADKEE